MTDRMLHLSSATTATLNVGCLMVLLCPLGARAADFPSKGDFRITFTAVNSSPTKPIPIGDNRTVAVNVSMMTAVNQAGSGLLHNMAGRCASMATTDAGAKTFENHGYCDYADADGDHVYERFDYPVQQPGATPQATGEWLGGTGKFVGIGGKFDIRSTRLTSLTDGASQFVGEKVGSYTVERSSASK